MSTSIEPLNQRDALRAKRDALFAEITQLEAREMREGPDAGVSERRANIHRGIERLDAALYEMEVREVETSAQNPNAVEPGWAEPPRRTREHDTAPMHVREARDAALRGIERHADLFSNEAGDRIEQIIRKDTNGLTARYIAAVSDPDYDSAFGKLLVWGPAATFRMDAREHEAVRRVSEAELERAMSEGTTTAGGFGVPVALDPSIRLTSNGALNPIRQLATVVQANTNVWKGVTSAGVSASFDVEADEVSDDTPTLAQPTITVQTARAFVPFSVEVGDDYPGLRQELARLISDSRDTLESSIFLSGTATPQPQGMLTGFSTAVKVTSAGTATLAIGDIYNTLEAVPARFTPGMSVLASPTMFDKIFRLTPSGSTTEPQAMPERGGPLVGRPKYEWSDMSTATTSTSKVLIAGDIREAYRIVDRVGLQVELIPHLLGSNRRPTLQRGLVAWWRVGAGVINESAARYLQIL